ncbi:MAG: restriction endonuclease [Candidatus Bathyarchaeota archaeon]|nr:restriction endonuclease [Candidatus Bathyarchaeota archaeon]
MSRKQFSFDELGTADLVVDATYRGGAFGDVRDDPLSRLMGCGNQGGFRIIGNSKTSEYKLAVLYSSLDDPDWPDSLDLGTGLFLYYGDNKRPGHELHDTPRKGNNLLRICFEFIHSTPPQRDRVPAFFVFTKGSKGRDVVFRGLAAPGSRMVKPTEDLVAIWKSTGGERFQNYRSHFTILNVPVIPRIWINDLRDGNPLSENCPEAWRRWVETGNYDVLQAGATLAYRKKSEQLPSNKRHKDIVNCIYEYFKDDPFGFEHCAAKIASLMDENIVSYDVTRPWRDGGRDAVGLYRIGPQGDSIKVEFALEAKCFESGKGASVKHTSRLISRLRHRQFGIFVTTSYIGEQAYKEIREDEHPVVIIAAEDIAKILVNAAIGTENEVSDWLKNNFPK